MFEKGNPLRSSVDYKSLSRLMSKQPKTLNLRKQQSNSVTRSLDSKAFRSQLLPKPESSKFLNAFSPSSKHISTFVPCDPPLSDTCCLIKLNYLNEIITLKVNL